jgi:hypothetical protein
MESISIMKKMSFRLKMKKLFLIAILASSCSLFANEVKVVNVKVNCSESKVCTFNVTLEHKDTGWKHFANKWEIYTVDNKLIATRTLHHPHVKEQPFTRSLSGIKIPKGVKKVIIKGHDLVHGYSDDVFVYEFK